MTWPCSKRLVTLVACCLECLFFSGLMNGWTSLQAIFKEDGYYLDMCNASLVLAHLSRRVKSAPMDNVHLQPNIHAETPITTINGVRYKCQYKKVLKVMSLADYEKYKQSVSTLTPEADDGVQVRHLQEIADNETIDPFCIEQDDHLEFIVSLIIIVRNLLLLPLGVFLDRYGTSKTRVIAMFCNVFGALTMLFSGPGCPWLILPALLMLGVSGTLVLLTDLQVANLFSCRRLTVMATLTGAYFSGGLSIYFMKLTREIGVSVQTSFMFITIGVVPILVSTIIMLPRSRIPWPLPANYGTNKNIEGSEGRRKPWDRRHSGFHKKQGVLGDFLLVARTKLYLCMVVWFSILTLKSLVYDLNIDVQIHGLATSDTREYVSYMAICLLFSVLFAPCIGVLMDRNTKPASAQQIHINQMRTVLQATCFNYAVAVATSVTSLIPYMPIQMTSFILVAIEKVTLYATLFGFLTHVHFPQEHFGKLVGGAMAVSGITMLLQYPIKSLIHNNLSPNTFYIHILMLSLMVIAACHPVCVMYHCKTGQIHNLVAYQDQERTECAVFMMENKGKADSGEHGQNQEHDPPDSPCLQITDL